MIQDQDEAIEAELKADIEDPKMMSFSDLDAQFENTDEDALTDDEQKVAFLSTRDMAELSYNVSLDFQVLMANLTKVDYLPLAFADLPDGEHEDWIDIAKLALMMQSEPDDEKFARSVHAKRAMRYLLEGWTFDEVHRESEAKTYYVAPWEALPMDKRIPLLWFKASIRTLYKLWDHDNPELKH